jgi:PAS domain S-box-containing protein
MKKPSIPNNENLRLEELNSYDILNSIEEDEYDFLTQMAAEICGTKISLVSLVTENKQWFKSHHGLKVRETNREYAFCAHAINQPNDVFVINDARKDERFFDNPLVTGQPHVVFYVGVPLLNNNGFALGTLCAIDDKPHKLTHHQIESLKSLSKQVMNLLELRKKTKELTDANKSLEEITSLLNDAQSVNKLGAWELDLKTGLTIWTDEVYYIHEVEKGFDHNKTNGLEFYHPEYRSVISEAIEESLESKKPFDVTCKFITAKNNLKWVRSTGKVLQENDANIKLVGTIQDITILKDNELKIIKQKQDLENILEGTEAGTWEWNVQTGETIFNERWAQICGYTLKELEPIDINTWLKLSHPDDLKASEKRLNDHFAGISKNYELESRMLHKDGHWIWVLDRGKVFSWTQDGKPLMMFGTHQDISKRKFIEYETSFRKIQLDTMYALSPIGISLRDFKTNHFEDANDRLLKSLGYTKEEFIKLDYWELTPRKYENLENDISKKLKKHGRYGPYEKEYINKNGKHFPISIIKFVIEDVDHKKRVWSFIEDMTVRKKNEDEKQDQLQKIKSLLNVTEEQNNRLKNFAHIVAHNLRSHSSGIFSLLEVLKEEQSQLSENEIFQFLLKASNNLSETIEHLTEVVEINLKSNDKYKVFNLKNLVAKIATSISSLAKNANVIIKNQVADDVLLSAIPAYIESIILNFLTNAIKYKSEEREQSFVKITTAKESHHVVIQFEDNGLGLDLKKHGKKIFGMFKTFHNNTEARGIGLFITKNQVEAMGGKIEVDSEENKGTIFKVYLPNERN